MFLSRHLFMLLSSVLIAFVIASCAGASDDGDNLDPAGDWQGILSTPQGDLRLLITATQAPDGTHSAVLESLDQAPGQKIPVSGFSIDAHGMTFTIDAIGASYSGTWNTDSQGYEGTFSQGMDLPLTFVRPGEASLPVIAGMDGVWQGVLDRGDTPLELVLNIETTEAGTQITLDSVSQAAYGIPVTNLARDGSTVSFQVPAANVRYAGELDASGDILAGDWTRPDFPDARVSFQRSADTVTGPNRPQTPQAPFPYSAEDVRFDNPAAEGVTLAGTLTVPPGDGPFPAVILISGSGPQDRDETVWTHRPFAVIADHLSRNGIAVLRYDDRGFGESTGDFAASTSMDFASDTAAALAWLKTRPEIDGGSIGPVFQQR